MKTFPIPLQVCFVKMSHAMDKILECIDTNHDGLWKRFFAGDLYDTINSLVYQATVSEIILQ